MQHPQVITDTRWRSLFADRWLRALFALAIALRVLLHADLWAHDPLTRGLLSDPALFQDQALALLAGTPIDAGRAYWMPPLQSWFLAACQALSGPSVATAIAVQALLGLFSALLLTRLVQRSTGLVAARFALALWTLYAPVVFFESRLLGVNLATCLGLLALLCALEAGERLSRAQPARLALCACGLAAGVASLAHPNLLLAAPALALVLAWRKRAQPLQAIACLLLVGLGLCSGLAPTWIHNLRAGQNLPVSANGGLNFWFGNNPQARGTFHAPGPEWNSIREQRAVSLTIASKAAGRSLKEAQASQWWSARARAWLWAEPLDAARLWSLKLADSLSSTEFGIMYSLQASRELAHSLWLPWVPFGLLLLLAALGWPSSGSARPLLVAWLLAALAAALLYFTYSRFRLPALGALLPFAGLGAQRLWHWLRGGPRPALATLGLGVLLCAQSFVPFEGGYARQLAANNFVDMATAAAAQGRPEQRVALLERALELVPANARALTELARAERERGALRSAFELLLQARALNLDYPPADYELAFLRLSSPDPDLLDPEHAVSILRSWLETHGEEHPERARFALLLAAALVDHPRLAVQPREARILAEKVLLGDPGNLGAKQILDALDQR